MEKLICKCHKEAEFVCQEHAHYLCKTCKATQGCKTMRLEAFSKKVVLKKKDLQNSLKALKFETKKNVEELMQVHNEMMNNLRKLRTQINSNLDDLINAYNKKIKKIIDTEINNNIPNLEKKMINMISDKYYLELNKYIDENPYGRIRKDEREKIRDINKMINTDSVYNDIFEYLKVVEKQTNTIAKGVKDIQFKQISDAEAAKQSCVELITQTLAKETKFFKIKANEDMGEKKGFDMIVTAIPKTESVQKIEETDQTNNTMFVPRHNSVRRGTELIDGTLALKLRQMGEKMFSTKEIKEEDESDSSGTELEELSIGTFEDSQDQMSGLSSDEEDRGKEFKDQFEESKGKFLKIINKTQKDISKHDFFNPNDKGKVNSYIKNFLEDSDKESKILLLNFNKI